MVDDKKKSMEGQGFETDVSMAHSDSYFRNRSKMTLLKFVATMKIWEKPGCHNGNPFKIGVFNPRPAGHGWADEGILVA